MKLTFIRFKNAGQVKKYIGFEVEENKEFIFKILLQSTCDFTIPKSHMTIFC